MDYSSFEYDFEVRSEKNIFKLEIERKELFSKINSYLEKNSIDASLNNISGLDSVETGFLIDFLCSYLPFSAEEKQLFLESKTLIERANLLLKVLGIAAVESKYVINPKTLH
ncbi:MAG TPA: hypothetical protein DIV86_03725 [Alphaproteobacteria bacterium]|nr:hypothetical protein [Alphaproteobacteria bacterium]